MGKWMSAVGWIFQYDVEAAAEQSLAALAARRTVGYTAT
jgi:hypothetical protein